MLKKDGDSFSDCSFIVYQTLLTEDANSFIHAKFIFLNFF